MRISYREVLASLCRESFYDFFREFWPIASQEPLVENWHHKLLCDELQALALAVFRGQPREYDLVINVCPGSTKSTICSQMFPAWVWTFMPRAQFICCSYAQQVALKDAIRHRDIVCSELYQSCFGPLTLREDENTKTLFVNSRAGFRYSVGTGGAVTGFHGHFLIVDDPMNPEQAFSEARLAEVSRWMTSTLPSRRLDKTVSPIILIQQRLHQSDPTGEMLQRGHVRHICLPGELTDDVKPESAKAFYVNGLFDPNRLPRSTLKRLREELGEYAYASQILQRPIPLGGGMFAIERIEASDKPPASFVSVVRSWDKAGTKDAGAYSVGVKMAKDRNGRFWVLDVVRGQWAADEREEVIEQTASRDGESVPILVEMEGGSGGKESGQATARRLAGYKVILYHPTGDKAARAYPFASQVGAGNVSLVKAPWNGDFLSELQYFPYSKYKDQVDAASAAFNYLCKAKAKIGGMRL